MKKNWKSFWKGFFSSFNIDYTPTYKRKTDKEILEEVNKSMEGYYKSVGNYIRSAMKKMDKIIENKNNNYGN